MHSVKQAAFSLCLIGNILALALQVRGQNVEPQSLMNSSYLWNKFWSSQINSSLCVVNAFINNSTVEDIEAIADSLTGKIRQYCREDTVLLNLDDSVDSQIKLSLTSKLVHSNAYQTIGDILFYSPSKNSSEPPQLDDSTKMKNHNIPPECFHDICVSGNLNASYQNTTSLDSVLILEISLSSGCSFCPIYPTNGANTTGKNSFEHFFSYCPNRIAVERSKSSIPLSLVLTSCLALFLISCGGIYYAFSKYRGANNLVKEDKDLTAKNHAFYILSSATIQI